MSPDEIENEHHRTFDEIRNEDEDGNEFWFARDLAPLLEYQQWRNFVQVIEKSKVSCQNSGQETKNHFAEVSKMVALGSGAKREVQDFKLSRYACYLIVQNGDPSKPVIALGQSYFALQTRRQEISDESSFRQLTEDERRLALRSEMTRHNKGLCAAAKDAGVFTGLDYAIF
ncbi:MAG: DNA damage-inducible protein D [Solidesulfovibrio sp.]|uniref:DNA damage-inducible protein D n=1 Tax=Solidesulfovibrio sp. TaxID=2910990 RepID=UPI003159192B